MLLPETKPHDIFRPKEVLSLCSFLQKIHNCHHGPVGRYEIYRSQIANDLLPYM